MTDETEESTPAWATGVVDKIDSVVGVAHDKAVVPLTTAARALVYGLLGGVLAFVVLVLASIMLIRIFDVYMPGDVWGPYAIVGGIFSLVGVFFWSKRSPKQT